MKRFVTYLYEYEKEVKTKNTGFIRVDIREPFVNIEICIRKFLREGEIGRVYVFVAHRGLYGIEVGKIHVQNGQGDLHLKLLAKNLQETGYSIEDVAGIGICFPNKSYLASCWMDAYAEAIGSASFAILKKEIVQQESVETNTDKRNSKAAVIKAEQSLETNPPSLLEKSDLESKHYEQEVPKMFSENLRESFQHLQQVQVHQDTSEYTLPVNLEALSLQAESVKESVSASILKNHQQAYSQEIQTEHSVKEDVVYTYQKIDLPQLREFPEHNIHYERNAFVIHGFWNYGYLILKTTVEEDKKKISLGIPGIYERQEATMAIMFGFPKFETIPKEVVELPIKKEVTFTKEEIEENQQPKEKTFGCWFVSVSNEALPSGIRELMSEW